MKEVIDTVSVALANGDTENVGNVVMQEVNRTLLSAGVDEVWADKIDNLIVLLFIIGIALLANIICRKSFTGGSQVGEADQSYLGRHCIQP